MTFKKALIALPLLGIGLVPATGAWAHPYEQTNVSTTSSTPSSSTTSTTTDTPDDTPCAPVVDDSAHSSTDDVTGLCTDLKIEKKAGSIDWGGKTVEWEMKVTNMGPDDVPNEQLIVVTDGDLTFSNYGLKVGEFFTVTMYPHPFVAGTCTQTNTASVALANMPPHNDDHGFVPILVIDGNMKNNTSTATFDSCKEDEATTTTTEVATTSSTQPATGSTTSSTPTTSSAPTTQSSVVSSTQSESATTNSQAPTTASGALTQGVSRSDTDVKSAVKTRSSNLPFTGANSSTFVALALGLIGIGLSVMFAVKRRTR